MAGGAWAICPQHSAAGDHAPAAMECDFGKLMTVASVIDVSSCLHI